MSFKVAVSRMSFSAKPTQAEYQMLHESGFDNLLLGDTDLPVFVKAGRSFTNWHTGPKRSENWQHSQMIVLDLEKHDNADPGVVAAMPFYTTYGYMLYTTMSHTPTAPRCRVVFFLSHPISDVVVWQNACRAVMQMFGWVRTIRGKVVPSPVDEGSCAVSRAFLGNPGAMMHVPGNVMDVRLAFMMAEQYRTQREREEQELRASHRRDTSSLPDTLDMRVVDKWIRELQSTPEGGRNNALNRIAFLVGKFAVARDVLTEQVATAMLIDAAIGMGLPESESRKTVQSGITKGLTAVP